MAWPPSPTVFSSRHTWRLSRSGKFLGFFCGQFSMLNINWGSVFHSDRRQVGSEGKLQEVVESGHLERILLRVHQHSWSREGAVCSYYNVLIRAILILRKTYQTSPCGKRNFRIFSSRRTWTNTFLIWGTTWWRSWWPELSLTSCVDIWTISKRWLFCKDISKIICRGVIWNFGKNQKKNKFMWVYCLKKGFNNIIIVLSWNPVNLLIINRME